MESPKDASEYRYHFALEDGMREIQRERRRRDREREREKRSRHFEDGEQRKRYKSNDFDDESIDQEYGR